MQRPSRSRAFRAPPPRSPSVASTVAFAALALALAAPDVVADEPPVQATQAPPSPPPSASAPSTSTPPASAPASDASASAPAAPAPAASNEPVEVTVIGKRPPPSRGASDYDVSVGKLSLVPRKTAADAIKLAPGVLLTNDGGEGHAEQVFLRGFDAREGQDLEFTMGGVPINESGNLHGNGYADTHFIIPELISSLRVLEGPFDPRQGNYAVAGSVDFQLGLAERGLVSKTSIGSFGTYRELLLWGPKGQGEGTFAGVELYSTDGFGQNRDARRGAAMAQYEARSGPHVLRVGASAYVSQFHSAGVIREDDYASGRVCFYCTYDPNQGGSASRYSVWAELTSHVDRFVTQNQVFAIARPMELRENFTGFLLDVQEPRQSPHAQRGDLIDLTAMEYTVGARGSARLVGELFGLRQEVEAGYYARGDFVHSTQTRIEAATHAPYATDADLDSTLGDIGLYVDANLRPYKLLALRGGVRADLFTYDVTNNCAVQSVAHASRTNPPGDATCLSQEDFGAYRLPFQRASSTGLALLPRASMVFGPIAGISASASWGRGARSVDPIYVTQDAQTPFASADSLDAGLSFQHRFHPKVTPVDVGLRSSFFQTRVDRDLLFSETAGRNVLCGASERDGVTGSARVTGRFFDVGTNLTWVHAVFTDDACGPAGALIPYIPPVVFRFDGALYGDLPWQRLRLRGKPFRASLSTGVTYVSPRPLPQGQTSDSIFTVDAAATLGYWLFDVGVSAQNLLDTQYRLGEYDYTSDFHTGTLPTLVPARMFSAGPPRTLLFTLAINLGGGR